MSERGPHRDERARRLFDIWAACVGWMLVAPLLAVLAIAVRFESPGPAVFRQRRIGRGGRPFTVYKFRTMRASAASEPATPVAIDWERDTFAADTPDPRVTGVGRALRRTSFDEMLQLINVIRGDMAIVGPRPELPSIAARYPAAYHRRHAVRPGITGLAQVSGRSDLTYAQTIRYDQAYVNRPSLRNDLSILARTVAVVLRGRGAR